MLLIPLLLLACSPDRPEPVPADRARSLALSVDLPFAELDLPLDSREGEAPPERIPLEAWSLVGSTDTSRTYEARLPIRLRSLFFIRPPSGMELVRATGAVIPHERYTRSLPSWSFTRETLLLELPPEAGAPEGLALRYPRATEREAALNLSFSGVEDPADFARTQVQAGPRSHAGLLLPAPAVAAWDVEVPLAAELWFRPGLVAPETLDGPPSDGARIRVEVEAGGEVTEVWSREVTGDDFPVERVDLSSWSGREVRLRVRTEPGESARFDYAFLAEPVLASRESDPDRVVMVFVDTLRADHLRLYGYERDTAPSLDALAAGGVVFEQARSVAPWTLPTARTLVTGLSPERYDGATTLPGLLRERGWATAFLAGNVYLSAVFDMERDWGLHQAVNWPSAGDQIDDAVEWLEAHDGRDAYLVLHFMDPHLPYQEPARYKRLYAGDRPDKLRRDNFNRANVVRGGLRPGPERQYVVDRYDNNIRYLHDELERLFAAMDGDDPVVYLSDHGEEFWDHDGFEHGHTLYEELVRVPLVIRAPGLEPGRVSEPVSLLDVVPTILDMVDVPAPRELEGTSLLPAARGDRAAREALAGRDVAFGRPLYGTDRWGVVHRGQKYTVHQGTEALYDLEEDPGETRNLVASEPAEATGDWRPILGEALGREVALGYRLFASRDSRRPAEDLVAELVVPGGVRAAWPGADYTRKSEVEVEVDGEVVRATWKAGWAGSREVWVVPEAAVEETTHALRVTWSEGEDVVEETIPDSQPALPDGRRAALARSRLGSRQLLLTWGIAPLPLEGAGTLSAYDDEVQGELEALGYTDPE